MPLTITPAQSQILQSLASNANSQFDLSPYNSLEQMLNAIGLVVGDSPSMSDRQLTVLFTILKMPPLVADSRQVLNLTLLRLMALRIAQSYSGDEFTADVNHLIGLRLVLRNNDLFQVNTNTSINPVDEVKSEASSPSDAEPVSQQSLEKASGNKRGQKRKGGWKEKARVKKVSQTDEIAELKRNFAELKEGYDRLKTRHEEMEAKVTTLSALLPNLGGQVVALQNNYQALQNLQQTQTTNIQLLLQRQDFQELSMLQMQTAFQAGPNNAALQAPLAVPPPLPPELQEGEELQPQAMERPAEPLPLPLAEMVEEEHFPALSFLAAVDTQSLPAEPQIDFSDLPNVSPRQFALSPTFFYAIPGRSTPPPAAEFALGALPGDSEDLNSEELGSYNPFSF